MNPDTCIRLARSAARRARILLAAFCAAGCTATLEPQDDDGAAAHSAALSAHVPDEIAVPDGHRFAFAYDAAGVQIYTCQLTASGAYGWVFQAPEADLFRRNGAIAGNHYAGPTWEALDGSTVVAARVASYSADPSAIPWLLLQATANTGDGRMSDVTYVQRVHTTGGVAPATGCDAGHAGERADVDYTAVYRFFQANIGCGSEP